MCIRMYYDACFIFVHCPTLVSAAASRADSAAAKCDCATGDIMCQVSNPWFFWIVSNRGWLNNKSWYIIQFFCGNPLINHGLLFLNHGIFGEYTLRGILNHGFDLSGSTLAHQFLEQMFQNIGYSDIFWCDNGHAFTKKKGQWKPLHSESMHHRSSTQFWTKSVKQLESSRKGLRRRKCGMMPWYVICCYHIIEYIYI